MVFAVRTSRGKGMFAQEGRKHTKDGAGISKALPHGGAFAFKGIGLVSLLR